MAPIIMCAILSVIYLLFVGYTITPTANGELPADVALVGIVGWGFSCVLVCLTIICGILIFGGKL